jgi:hypothetical protein
MLSGVVILCTMLTYLASLAADARRQANSVRILQRLGATVTYDFHLYENDGPTINRARKPADWIWARKLLGNDCFSNVYRVDFIQQRWWQGPSGLSMGFEPVPTATMISRAADKYIHLLRDLPNLQSLDLSCSTVSDTSGPELARLRSLQALLLNDTVISDKTIPHLAKLPLLKLLAMENTLVTREGRDRLRESLPRCEIYWRQRLQQ